MEQSLEIYFDRVEFVKDFKERSIRVERALKNYETKNGSLGDTEKRSLRKELYKILENQVPKKNKNILSQRDSLFYKNEIDFIKTSGPKKYNKKELLPKERIELTIEAERNGLASYTIFDNDDQFLIVCDSKNEEITDAHNELFLKTLGYDPKDIQKDQFLQDIELLNLHSDYKLFCQEVSKYGIQGLKRRNIILEEYIIDYIQKDPKYQKLLEKKQEIIKDFYQNSSRFLSKSYTIAKKQYNPSNDNVTFISLDIKCANFVSYRENGVFSETTWEQFIRRFTVSQYIANNKTFRVRLFGKLESKLNQILWQKLIVDVWKIIEPHCHNNLVAIENDEILLRPSDPESTINLLKTSILIPSYVKITCYKLKYIEQENAYLKIFPDQTFELKGINRAFYISKYKNILEHLKKIEK
ncbi:MAG: hypothetical protein Dasosvirus4_12 [Dasosvirus sp.]|uniref:Uncharacterized protein n=1 Tax=Dasosvirus sp. TaxID=2487764 RepID=A0A3G4ZU16_9VIRU|nr:MAG: hypothetical protein Dasosvirus4_12 [Dasosvirus sp.]